MATYYHNPENALKRAYEFMELGKEDEALECLYNVLKNRKHRLLKHVHESIINKFLELCVELKRGQTAKEGLYSYRNLCLGVNVKSWEDAICKYIQLAEKKVENAQELFKSIVLDVDDLDQDVTPEILLKSVSIKGAHDRTERVTLLPWIKFLWECHRNSLDLLRGTQTDRLYHMVAQNAFKFCVKYSRRTELRKLCNILRIQATHMQKRQIYLKAYDLETQLMYLETGFLELESAIDLDLWQDAFKAIEGIHSIINSSKKFQNSRLMAHYFEKISCVFWKGEEFLFHAAALLRYFLIVRDQKKTLTSCDITKLASRVLLAVLCVPFAPNNNIIDFIAETDVSVFDRKVRLLSNLLDLPKCPTRPTLIKDVVHLGIFQYVPDELQDLFHFIEYSVDPSAITAHFEKAVNFIQRWDHCSLEQYIPLLHKIVIVRLLYTLSCIYTTIKLPRLFKFFGDYDISYLERTVLDSARRYEFPIRVDHENQCIIFSSSFDIFRTEKSIGETDPEDQYPESGLKCLMYVHSSLNKVVKQLKSEDIKNENKQLASKIASHYTAECEHYHKRLLNRKNIIEKYKENIENMKLQKEEEEKKLITAKLLQHEAVEKERLLREAEERNLQRLQREQEEIKRKLLLEKIETFKKSTSQIVENFELDDIDNLDPQILFCKQIQQLNKERKEMSSRLRRQERTFSHTERAKRIEEIPFLEKEYDEYKVKDLELWKEYQQKKLEYAYTERDQNVQKKNRMIEIKKDLLKFLEIVKRKRHNSYVQEMEEYVQKLKEIKLDRLKKRAQERKHQRKLEWEMQQKLLKEKQRQVLKERYKIKQRESSKSIRKKDSNVSKERESCKTKEDEGIKRVKIMSRQHCAPLVKPKISENAWITSRAVDIKIKEESNSSKNFRNVKDEKSSHSKDSKCDNYIYFENSQITNDIFKTPDAAFYDEKQLKTEVKRADKYERQLINSERSTRFRTKVTSEMPKSSYSAERMPSKYFQRTEEAELTLRAPVFTRLQETPWKESSWKSNRNAFIRNGIYRTLIADDNNTLDVIPIPVRHSRNIQIYSDTAFKKSDEQKNDIEHSCTPWAKLKRQATDK